MPGGVNNGYKILCLVACPMARMGSRDVSRNEFKIEVGYEDPDPYVYTSESAGTPKRCRRSIRGPTFPKVGIENVDGLQMHCHGMVMLILLFTLLILSAKTQQEWNKRENYQPMELKLIRQHVIPQWPSANPSRFLYPFGKTDGMYWPIVQPHDAIDLNDDDQVTSAETRNQLVCLSELTFASRRQSGFSGMGMTSALSDDDHRKSANRVDEIESELNHGRTSMGKLKTLCELQDWEEKYWTIIWDNLSSIFRSAPPISQLKIDQFVSKAFESAAKIKQRGDYYNRFRDIVGRAGSR
ncbi:unnamed protein product [Angiostrongylus costaricensis]|uniref:Uncharacterized protein n=1 Tax=Angiostrongylus costaricensis TaxID=334426 RepID=A0A158PKX6_ANGCS|nr:unnamed protein product [Angiostrongylus costaricensis]